MIDIKTYYNENEKNSIVGITKSKISLQYILDEICTIDIYKMRYAYVDFLQNEDFMNCKCYLKSLFEQVSENIDTTRNTYSEIYNTFKQAELIDEPSSFYIKSDYYRTVLYAFLKLNVTKDYYKVFELILDDSQLKKKELTKAKSDFAYYLDTTINKKRKNIIRKLINILDNKLIKNNEKK